jgi:hypothetical protein
MRFYRATYRDPKTGARKESANWSYEFEFAGKRIRESAKTTSKTVARHAAQERRRQLEKSEPLPSWPTIT